MTDKVNPSINRPAEAFLTAGAIAYGGHGSATNPGFIVDGASPTELAQQDAGITEGNLNSFAETSSGASQDVDIDPGEAFIFGAWAAIDTTTQVTLASSTNNQTVYVGWNKDGTDDVIVGLDAAFESASGNTDIKIPLYDYDTDATGVTSVTDRRVIGYVQGATTFTGEQDLNGNNLVDGATTIWDEANGTLGTDTVDAGAIQTDAVDTAEIAADAVQAAEIATDAVGTDALDLSIAPTWTGEHQFNAGIEIAEGQSIQDDGNVSRITFNSGFTNILSEAGNQAFKADDGTAFINYARSGTPWRVSDEEGAFTAFQYTTSATSPGSLTFGGAYLDINSSPRGIGLPTFAGNPSSTTTADIWYDTSAD